MKIQKYHNYTVCLSNTVLSNSLLKTSINVTVLVLFMSTHALLLSHLIN